MTRPSSSCKTQELERGWCFGGGPGVAGEPRNLLTQRLPPPGDMELSRRLDE